MAQAFPVPRRIAVEPRRILIAVLLVALAATVAVRLTHAGAAHRPRPVPHSAAMEQRLGVRFNHVAVVGDGGLVEVSYVVLDPEKASRFQNDTTHPPKIYSESGKHGVVWRTALMKQGHSLRAGQTYYMVFENTKAAVRSGGKVKIVAQQAPDLVLKHVPVD